MNNIKIWNRNQQIEETEAVYGGQAIDFLYGNPTGQKIAQWLLSTKAFSRAYGSLQDSLLSQAEIARFIEKFKIPMDEYESGPYRTFNEFFIRKFRPGKRAFVTDKRRLPAFAEGRYFAFETVEASSQLPVKGFPLTLSQLLGKKGSGWVSFFEGGPALVARLCPVDYHRFHFPDDGVVVNHYREAGKLHSVNPAALRFKPDIFLTNERQISILETTHFGKLAYIEVGAMSVGKIIQTYKDGTFSRGDEKGYFLFGGSTVILLGQKGRWVPSADLVEQTQSYERETLVRLGQEVGVSL